MQSAMNGGTGTITVSEQFHTLRQTTILISALKMIGPVGTGLDFLVMENIVMINVPTMKTSSH